jgi:hypothetical protein
MLLVLLQVCGVTNAEDAHFAAQQGANLIGKAPPQCRLQLAAAAVAGVMSYKSDLAFSDLWQ